MIIVDTNVISEPMRPSGSAAVRAWFNAQHPESLFTTAICVAELLAGVAVLPAGKRRTELNLQIRTTLTRLFGARVLAFDIAAAEHYATIAERSRAEGRVVPHDDAQIAAIARTHGFAVATRNQPHFAGAGVLLINPWDYTQ